ncbi:MAG: hypothetical protein F6J90_15810 [Moorea sp. SIOASIH]|uniref:PAAR domain-containing protein n=1 Tax=Moorena sp. SIOASIH TaxID=2607817 RepID=UPI0013BBE94F|nr:PAAR domain-containing protein [Moorena sp. SIOASIH]NEO37714.1 hypothetical protein [Moorena sp. SIOASIH]
MGQPAARKGDLVVTSCTHQVQGQPPAPAPPIVAPMPIPFQGKFEQKLSKKVKIGGKFVALKGSQGKTQVHPPIPPPGTSPIKFVKEPNKTAEITKGSSSVKIEGKPVARIGDPVKTCSELPPPHGTVSPGPGKPTKVFIGG